TIGERWEPSRDRGVDVTTTRGDYITKLGLEITHDFAKKGRHGNRTPWQVLDGATRGQTPDVALWREERAGTKGGRRLTWSKGLRGRAASPATEGVSDEVEEAIRFSRAEWLVLRDVPDAIDVVLTVAEDRGELSRCVAELLVIAVTDTRGPTPARNIQFGA